MPVHQTVDSVKKLIGCELRDVYVSPKGRAHLILMNDSDDEFEIVLTESKDSNKAGWFFVRS